MASSDSIVDLHDVSSANEKDEVDSLPSISTDDIYSEADSDSDAQAEWERSMEQLQLLLTMMIVPWMGKYFGRKFAYWSKPLGMPRKASWPAIRRNIYTDGTASQVGRDTWNGCTMSTSSGRIKRPSRL